MNNYKFYQRYCEHAYNLPTPAKNKKALLQCLYAAGLFANGKFHEAGEVLSLVQYSKYEEELRQIMTPSDYAHYLVISTLASFSRTDLKKVDTNQGLKSILEGIPNLNKIIEYFLSSRYTDVFEKLYNTIKDNEFDTIFTSQIKTAIRLITEKAIIQYCRPYKSVDLKLMSKTLGTNIVELEDNLINMSSRGLIKGKIDSQNKVLFFIIIRFFT